MEPNHQESLRFLQFIYPQGPWTLTAITVDQKSIESRTFVRGEDDEVIQWLRLHNRRNIYYCVNEPTQSAYSKTKLSKADIHRAHFVHVDVDPRAGELVSDEQRRIHDMIMSYSVRPSVVVFSGGGYNVLWKLTHPVDIAANSASPGEVVNRAIDFERRNWQIELDLGADSCRDVSRILRLPGTLNRPTAKKIAKGRDIELARIEFIDESAVHDYASFRAVPHVSVNVSSNESGARVLADAVHVQSLDDLDVILPHELKVIIAQGFDPEDPHRWNGDRSSALFYVCCELVRRNIPDELVLGIITDPKFGISESVLDKGAATMRYATRQVERAKDYADDPLLERMNSQFAIILGYGSETAVMVEEGAYNIQTGSPEPIFQRFSSFRNRIKNWPDVVVSGGPKPKTKSAFEWWTSHARRREFIDVTFQPGIDTPGRFNMWSGFAVQPAQGGAHERWLDHLYTNICRGEQEYFDYLMGWMARTVQEPRTQSMVAPVIIGERGTGKSVFTDGFSRLFAPHRYVASDVNELSGKFNNHLGQCLVVVAEEAFDLRDKRHTSVLKELITGGAIGVERKGVDRLFMPNYVHLLMTSNPDSAGNRIVPAGDHERRFFVLRSGNKKRQNSSYFRPILKDMYEEGGMGNLLYYLMDYDISEFDVTLFPDTPELREQQEYNLSRENEWLLTKLEEGQWFRTTSVSWEGPVVKRDLHTDYMNFMQEVGARTVKGARAFHRFIMQAVPGTVDRQMMLRGERPMVFMFPPLAQCRDAFDRARGWHTEWPPILDEADRQLGVMN